MTITLLGSDIDYGNKYENIINLRHFYQKILSKYSYIQLLCLYSFDTKTHTNFFTFNLVKIMQFSRYTNLISTKYIQLLSLYF